MAASCIRKIAFQTLQNKTGWYICKESARYFHNLSIQTVTMIPPSSCIIPNWKQACWMLPLKTFTTAGEDEPQAVQHKMKKDLRARTTIGSIGRKISHRIIHVIDENGEDLGNLHRADVIRMMDERGVKIVPFNENADPPVYKLMTGKQIHEEQMKLREKQKAKLKTGVCQIKEQTFSADIAKHDLQTKIKHIQQWVEKHHHVRITVRKGAAIDKVDEMESLLDQIVQSMPDKATYMFRPKIIKEGKAVMCVLRHLSEKEMKNFKQSES
ncbi:translation initiation factor IF-3, mitochondrial [Pristis pectinata]|uniref:translation initiation factor IF-3, mitochondrial n=1 Tax=Pristis pectinata TaxID=685728 RepID=UPI00223E43E8|nr:translation initiation factor IF-3, mitochondrial [Pristis pectinata]XP_051881477.1 translation initiation factor IF-3, mitochondrial [Pristis pectinata]XP_051881478.1 translation initiation factor IF-3, mitochondrial [Pristis pectinata]